MGYNLGIGEAVVEWDEDMCRVGFVPVQLQESPAFGDPTDNTNERWPSYTAWSNAMEALGMMDLMFNDRNGGGGFERNGKSRDPLIASHPGVTPVTREHVEEVEERLAAYKAKHPDHRAEYPPPKPDAKPIWEGSTIYRNEDYVDDPRYDGALCRGEWLLFWLKWAVENCKQPVFFNS